ncbi:MAG TPA: hypothetical protein VKR32_10560 [Puia sp.]|nr:hypothetical protein [Puia sp.]
MDNQEQRKLTHIMLDLEKKYPFFKKMDIYSTVSDAFKKIHNKYHNKVDEHEFEEVRRMADHELQLS